MSARMGRALRDHARIMAAGNTPAAIRERILLGRAGQWVGAAVAIEIAANPGRAAEVVEGIEARVQTVFHYVNAELVEVLP